MLDDQCLNIKSEKIITQRISGHISHKIISKSGRCISQTIEGEDFINRTI